MDLPVIPVAKITANSLTTYAEWPEGMPERNTEFDSILFPPENNEASGQVTRKVHMRIKNITKAYFSAVYYLNKAKKNSNQLSGKRIKFVTLTLPAEQSHTDREIKRNGLRVFLQRMKRKYGLTRWVWKAEKQNNGNIHFHLLWDEYIDYKTLEAEWNKTLNKLGYIEQYRKKMQKFHQNGFQVRYDLLKNWNKQAQYKSYLQGVKNNWSHPNTTDIKKLYNTKNPEGYISKYTSKTEVGKEIDGRVWDASDDLKEIPNFVDQCNVKIDKVIEALKTDDRVSAFHDEYFSSYSGPIGEIVGKLMPELLEDIAGHFEQCLNAVYKAEHDRGPLPGASPPPASAPTGEGVAGGMAPQ